jgi:Zn-dependent protease
MKKSLRIGSVAGIGIFLHWTFGLLVAGLFAYFLYEGNDIPAALTGIAFVGAVFGCVVLHELGHALTARHFDVPTRDITLYPIGGVARLERIPEEPMKEFWIAVAGPAVNVAIAAVLAVGVAAFGGGLELSLLLQVERDPATSLLWLNLALVGFNMLPAFPMDGGRVLRAVLASRMDYTRATQIASNVGQGMAILFGLVGIYVFNPVLLFIALFVWVGAQQESQQAIFRTLTEGTPVRQAMMTRFATLAPDDTLDDAADELLAGAEHDIPVVEGGQVVGMLRRQRLIEALSERGRDTPVRAVAERIDLTVEDTAMLREAFQRIQAADCSTVPVVREGRLVGLLTLENVGELIMLSSALRKKGGRLPDRQRLADHRGEQDAAPPPSPPATP